MSFDLLKNATKTGLPILWSYWEGNPIPPFIDLCFETLEKHNSSFVLATPELVHELGGWEILDFAKDLPIPQRADYIRLWLLYNFGGVWTDADVICLAPLDWLLQAHDYDLIGVYNKYHRRGWGKHLLATPWGCRAGSPLIGEALQLCKNKIQRMKNGERIPYGETSVGIMSGLFKREHKAKNPRILRHEHWKYNRVPWHKARRVYFRKGPFHQHEWSREYNPAASMYHLTNPIPHRFKKSTREEILDSNTFASFLIKKSLGMLGGLPGRSWEILRRLPQHPVNVVEVGVFQGRNSRQLLQQRHDMELHLVDPWDDNGNEERYRNTKDGRAFDTKEKRQHALTLTRKHTAFAGDRVHIHRGTSVGMSESFSDDLIDLVFLDAEHSYAAILEDIDAWYPKIRPGGFIGGHDYNNPRFPGVIQGVNEWAENNGHNVESGNDYTWFVRKG